MEKQVMEQVGNLVKLGKDGIMKAVGVLQEQCPLLVDEIYKWEMSLAIAWAIIFFIFSLFFIYCFNRILTRKWSNHFDDDDRAGLMSLSLLFFSATIAAVINNVMVCVKIHVAPKLFLFDYVSKLIK